MNHWRVLLLLLLTVVAAVATDWPLLFNLAYLLGGVLVLGWVWTRAGLGGAHLSWEVPAIRSGGRLSVGSDLVQHFAVRNRWPLPKLWLALLDGSSLPGADPGRVMSLPPLGAAAWTSHTRCQRRGEYRIGPLVLCAGDPFGCFVARRKLGATHRLLVLPATDPLPDFHLPGRDLPGGARARPSGTYSSVQTASVREYVPGDPLGRIHWRSTARAAHLMVKELEHEPAADVWLALDLHAAVHLGEGDDSTEEYAVAVAASITRRFLEAGRSVGLVAHGDRHILLRPDRGERQLLHILEALAVVRAVGRVPLADLLWTDGGAGGLRPGRGAALVTITPSLEPTWPDALQLARAGGARPVAILVEPSTFGGAAGSLVLVSRLAGAGVPTYLVKHGEPIGQALVTT